MKELCRDFREASGEDLETEADVFVSTLMLGPIAFSKNVFDTGQDPPAYDQCADPNEGSPEVLGNNAGPTQTRLLRIPIHHRIDEEPAVPEEVTWPVSKQLFPTARAAGQALPQSETRNSLREVGIHRPGLRYGFWTRIRLVCNHPTVLPAGRSTQSHSSGSAI